MNYPLLSGRTPVVYHTIPSDLSHLLTTPSRENIMAYLSQIPGKLFPEFVKDILVNVEKHTLVDVVDGPGDEKLDILTITSDGRRCLTQCKLTGNLYPKYNGEFGFACRGLHKKAMSESIAHYKWRINNTCKKVYN